MLQTVDVLLILAYILFTVGVGFYFTRKASKGGIESYFLAGRNLPWWWLGTSMVATTFAADTPLAITGITAKDGISGNWFWWSWVLSYLTIAILFASRWRKSKVLTDVELIEMRYSGKPAAYLRAFKAVFLGVLMNSIILGWVFSAMSSITRPFLMEFTGSSFAGSVSWWPGWLMFETPAHSVIIVSLFAIVVFYSSLGGLRGVILTDLIQFGIAIAGSFAMAWFTVSHFGGIGPMLDQVVESGQGHKLSFWPDFRTLPITVFAVYFTVQWWTQYHSDGSGYLAQRASTAKDPVHATVGSIWFVVLNFVVRTWPWILVAIGSMAIFYAGSDSCHTPEGAIVCENPEAGYPVLMKMLLPPGMLGFVLAGLFAAFMSTVDTHINWGASYLTNDIYKRFINPKAGERKLALAGRVSVLLIALISLIVAAQIASVAGAWKFLLALASGMGLAQLMRWFWYRVNAYSEMSAMVAAAVSTGLLYKFSPDMLPEHVLAVSFFTSLIVCVTVTLMTRPADDEKLKEFVLATEPSGFWPDRLFPQGLKQRSNSRLKSEAAAFLCGAVSVPALMLSVGYFLFGDMTGFLISLATALFFSFAFFFSVKRLLRFL